MEENKSPEVYLTMEERLGKIKDSLRKVIEIVTDDKNNDAKKSKLVGRTLEDFFVHIEAAGPELALNKKQRFILNALKTKGRTSTEAIAHVCAQFLGTLNYEEYFAKPYKNQSLLIKVIFLKEANKILEKLVDGKGNMDELYKLEELISRFMFLEDEKCDSEIRELCFDIESSVKNAFIPGGRIDFMRLKIQYGVIMAIRGKLQTGLS